MAMAMNQSGDGIRLLMKARVCGTQLSADSDDQQGTATTAGNESTSGTIVNIAEKLSFGWSDIRPAKS